MPDHLGLPPAQPRSGDGARQRQKSRQALIRLTKAGNCAAWRVLHTRPTHRVHATKPVSSTSHLHVLSRRLVTEFCGFKDDLDTVSGRGRRRSKAPGVGRPLCSRKPSPNLGMAFMSRFCHDILESRYLSSRAEMYTRCGRHRVIGAPYSGDRFQHHLD